MITVDLKINCDCQLIATDYTNYCNLEYDISEVVVVEGITGIGYKVSRLNEGCVQKFKSRNINTSDDFYYLNRAANSILNPCSDLNAGTVFGTFDYINGLVNQILDPCDLYPDDPLPEEPDYDEDVDLNCNCINDPISIWTLPKDGYYRYYKVAVYNKPSKGQIYWDGLTLKNGNSILSVEDLDSYLMDPTLAFELGILNYCTPIPFFSICNLKKCVMELQKKHIQDHLPWCNKMHCKQYDDEEFKFLFITVSLLEQLIECGKYSQVEKILESISTCTSICSNLEYNKKCNCHG